MEGTKLSFGFSKQKRVLKPPVTKLEGESSQPKKPVREYVTSIEGTTIHTDKPPEERLVIPVPRSHSGIAYRIRQQRMKTEPTDELTTKAIEEIKQEALGSANSPDPSRRGLTQISLPADGNSETTGDQVEDANYETMPVEEFGIAALTGMGIDRDALKHPNSERLGPIRPKGLGLGADPMAVKSVISDLKSANKETLKWRVGAPCQVIFGKHNQCYGMVNGFDGDTGRVYVKLTLLQLVVPILQPMLRLVTEKEYSAYAHCLNQAAVDRYKTEEEESQVNGGSGANRSEEKRYHGSSRSQPKANWPRPNLLVRLVDHRLGNGRHYKQKMVITSIDPQSGHCTCKTLSGELLEGVPPNSLQTVVPDASDSPSVMILSGIRTGEMGKVVKCHRSSNEVDVRTRAGTMIVLTYDEVCAVAE